MVGSGGWLFTAHAWIGHISLFPMVEYSFYGYFKSNSHYLLDCRETKYSKYKIRNEFFEDWLDMEADKFLYYRPSEKRIQNEEPVLFFVNPHYPLEKTNLCAGIFKRITREDKQTNKY